MPYSSLRCRHVAIAAMFAVLPIWQSGGAAAAQPHGDGSTATSRAMVRTTTAQVARETDADGYRIPWGYALFGVLVAGAIGLRLRSRVSS